MCSWCWGFSQAWQQLQTALPDTVTVTRLLGGLAADTNAAMPMAMQKQIAETWQQIRQHIPGVDFNFAFWENNQPRRSTYSACRAVIAARAQGRQYDLAMTLAIQRAYYQQARNPSDEGTLTELAKELELDSQAFANALNDPDTETQLQKEIQQARALHVDSFPSLVLEYRGEHGPIPIDYKDYQTMLEAIENLI